MRVSSGSTSQTTARSGVVTPVTSGPGEPLPQRYQISVCGRVRKTMRLAFPGLQAEAGGGDTVLTGALADSPALYGVLAELEALGVLIADVGQPGHWR